MSSDPPIPDLKLQKPPTSPLQKPAARIPGRRLLHSPGPTPLPDEVLHALMRQPMDLGDPRVMDTITACEQGLRGLLQSATAEVFFFACNGHGVWEAAVQNLITPGGLALVPGTGHFSESWAIQTEALGRRVLRTPWHEGWPIDAAAVAEALRQDRAADGSPQIEALFMVHTDTSSGVTSSVDAMRAALDEADHPALLVVDLVASLAVEPFEMDRQRVDVVLGASQKGLMCPPGVGILATNAAAFAVAQRNPAQRFYWDIVPRKSDLSYRKFCGTPPHNIMAALQAALGLLQLEGLPQVWARHQRLAGLVHAAVEGWREGGALDFFCREAACRSNAVTTISVPAGTDVEALRALAREDYQVAFAGALGPLQGRGFRIGHLGDQNPAGVLGALSAVEAALLAQGLPLGAGGVQRAVHKLARG